MRPAFLLTAVALLGATQILLHSRGNTDQIPDSVPLDQLPIEIGGMVGTDIPLESYVLDVLGKGVFLNRSYAPLQNSNSQGQQNTADKAGVGVFIGYFPTQRTGQAIHSPQNCLPGAGWTFLSKGTTVLQNPSGKPATVGEYLISNGNATDEVLYWYRSHGRSIANDYAAKWYMLSDSIRLHRTDAALVRVITPVIPGEGRQAAHDRAVNFATQMNQLLPPYLPD